MKDDNMTQEKKAFPVASFAWEIPRSESAFVPANNNQPQNSVLQQLLAYRSMKKSEAEK